MKREHKTFFGKIFGTAWDAIKSWFSDIFEKADHRLLEAAILVTNAIKEFLQSGVVTTVIQITPTKVDDKLLEIVNEHLTKILSAELLVKGLNGATNEEDVQDTIRKVVDTFGGFSDADKEELYTSIAARVYILYQKIENGNKVTFGKAAALSEGAYQEWLANSKTS